ncbi:hypothetical protein V6N12_014562 [Hibiscus sabdariffa]|uniref:NADP-dependent oxidoreductase domain-containing protein n=1 Tax=Hibiscus sabdariffa TaxID=183260 RepID=A0ABR2DKK4_9ROSI
MKLGSQGLEALKQIPEEKVRLATKFGIVGMASTGMIVKGSPKYGQSCCEASLKHLNVITSISIISIGWTLQWVELKQLVEEGKIKYIGLSESSPDMISRMRLSLFADIDRCLMDLRLPFSDLGIIVVPYSPLGRGFFSGKALWRVYMRELSWYS